jgi:hypothetical protein
MLSKDEYLRRMRDPKWYGEQDENGVDLSLIRENLKLTPEERLLKADRARRGALELQEIGRRHFKTDHCRQRQYIEEQSIEIDLRMIRENLKLTPEERLLKMEGARKLAAERQNMARLQQETDNG